MSGHHTKDGEFPLQIVMISNVEELAEYVKDHAKLHRQIAVKWNHEDNCWEVSVAGVTS